MEDETFRGQFDHAIDSKGRISIPQTFRTLLQERSEKPPMLTRGQNHLRLYPAEEWERIEQELRDKPRLQPAVQKLRRVLIGSAVPCPIDTQGRILIPKNLRSHAHLEAKVTLTGVIEMIEIWNTDLYENMMQDDLGNLDEIQEAVDQASN